MSELTADEQRTRPSGPRGSMPRGALITAAAMVFGSLGLVAFTRLTSTGPAPETGTVVASRDLRFADRPDGGIGVFVPGQAEPIDIVAPASNGFIRGTLRGLNRERRREDLAADVPFRIRAYADGRLTLEDLSNGRRIDLIAFGHINAEAFARLLTVGTAP